MFSLFKSDPLKRELTKISELYATRSRSLDTSSSDELSTLRNEAIILDLDKLALAFDTLKASDSSFPVIDKKSLWKLDKPARSTGTVFFTDESRHYFFNSPFEVSDLDIALYRNLDVHRSTLELISKGRPYRHLINYLGTALVARDVREYESKLRLEWFSHYGLRSRFSTHALMLARACSTAPFNNFLLTPLPDIDQQQLKDIATTFKINIITTKGPMYDPS